MDAKTAQALEASIKHWQDNVAAELPESASTNAHDCALCRVFNTRSLIFNQCRGCPVFIKTGEDCCDGTPYEKAADALFNWQQDQLSHRLKRAWQRAARKELAFLISLREPVGAKS